MAKIETGALAELVNLFLMRGGKGGVDQLRTEEGVAVVYDVAQLFPGQFYALSTRSFDSGAIAENVGITSAIASLPQIARLLAFHAQTDDASRVSQVWLYYEDIRVATASTGRDTPLWLWRAGGDTIALPAVIDIGNADLGTLLVPAAVDEWVSRQPIYRDLTGASRNGASQLSVRTVSTAFGAGSVRVTGHVTLAFPLTGETVVPQILPPL